MPYKNYENKIRYNQLHNPNRVGHYRDNKEGCIRFNLNGIKNRNYVCELCGDFGKTEFHEISKNNPYDVLECCVFCHTQIRLQTFDDSKLFME